MQIVIDCKDPANLAKFWAQALNYKVEDPPKGYSSWPEFLKANNVPENQWNKASAIVDPAGVKIRIFFQQVPEPKTTKNRVHIDLNTGGGPGHSIEEQKENVTKKVAELEKLGAKKLEEKFELGTFWAVMQDPEDNEFCV